MSNGVSAAGQPVKKGLSPLAWVGIGCGSLMILGFVVFMALGLFVFKKGKEVVNEATGGSSISDFMENLEENPTKVAAETVVRMNPDLELLSTDDDEGTITFRNSKNDEEVTLNFEDIAEGRFGFSTDEGDFSYTVEESGEGAGIVMKGPDGEARFGGAADPDQIPEWVSVYPGVTATQSSFHSSSQEEVAGILGGKTGDSATEVMTHFSEFFENGGWKVISKSETTTGDGAMNLITGEHVETGRTLAVTAIEASGETQVMINYSGKPD